MGQCSTMPDHHGGGGGGGESTSPPPYYHHSRHDNPSEQQNRHYQHSRSQQPRQQRDDYADHRRATESTGRNPNNNEHGNNMYMEEDPGHSSGEDPKTPLMRDASRNNTANMTSFLNVVRQSVNALDPFLNDCKHNNNNMQPPPNTGTGYATRNSRVHPSAEPQQDVMMNTRQQPPPSPSLSIPPNSTRMRCYRLNLESNSYISSNNIAGNNIATYGSDDEDSQASTRKIAMCTAKIFRGITVSRDGTVSSRKMRSSNNNVSTKGKVGEKSRQAAKIDKAKDLVEQSAKGGKGTLEGTGTDDDPSNMIALFIMGEYDDIKYLVRDGSKKLKDADGLPDESLLAINRPRASNDSSRQQQGGPFYIQDGQPILRNSITPSSSRSKYQSRSSSRTSRMNNSVPPKLKGHPRDTSSRYHASTPTGNTSSNRHSQSQQPQQSSRTSAGGSNTPSANDNAKFQNVPHQCSEFNIFGAGDSDWSEALNFSKGFHSIWNCGASGAEVGGEGGHHNNPHHHHHYERESGSRQTRRVRSYSNEEFRAMKQQQQSRYNNHVNMEGREDMVVDRQQQPPSQHGCFGATSSKHSSRYTHHSSMNQGQSVPSVSHHHPQSSNRAANTSANSRSSNVNDVILV